MTYFLAFLAGLFGLGIIRGLSRPHVDQFVDGSTARSSTRESSALPSA